MLSTNLTSSLTSINEKVLDKTAARCRERGIRIPTLAQQKDPTRIPRAIRDRLQDVGLWDVDPANLFRITWYNEPREHGGGFNSGNWIEFPPALTGVEARIIGMVGKHFPTGAHKVGAAFGCLVPKLVTGQFDPETHRAVWPSTGNYCRGGAFDCALLACEMVAILPEGMSRERFDWLRDIGAEVIATPGCESNVKEIYDACWELRRTRPECVILNQFEDMGNATWHYHVTGTAIRHVYEQLARPGDRLSAYVSATGSAGTLAAGDYLRRHFPLLRVVTAEALQCPTLLQCGFGDHRIEGIGDKHVPWIHNVRNTDMVCAVDDEQCMALLRLFNEEHGHEVLAERGLPAEWLSLLPLVGISGLCNLIAAIKAARYYEFGARDCILLPLTDSVELYQSRLDELRVERGEYTRDQALRDEGRHLDAITIDHLRELNYQDRKTLHNFKYFTWVEQQGKSAEELRLLWEPDFWEATFGQGECWDALIDAFNERVGL